jgi:hypothetical protein
MQFPCFAKLYKTTGITDLLHDITVSLKKKEFMKDTMDLLHDMAALCHRRKELFSNN